jgi:regulatory protein
MIVTKISQQLKNIDRANIFIDGKYSFSLNLNQVLETKIKVGLEIDDSDLIIFKKLSSDGKLKMRAIEWLMLRPHSKKELLEYLRRKKLEPEQIEEWTNNFQQMGYQNDENFTKWWIEQRLNKQKSKRFIINELRGKGIDNETIQACFEESPSEQETLKMLINKKRKISKYQDNKKLTEYLLRQGFSYSLIKEVLAG